MEFCWKTNDIQGHGEINKGNWLSGIPFIDNARLGPQDSLPKQVWLIIKEEILTTCFHFC